jgi:putative ATP-dependent endonuclease of OLD family
MRIKKILIHNFRSIIKAEIEPSVFNVFVGQNNHGKTNLFDAIQWFYSPDDKVEDLRPFHKQDLDIIVEIEFADLQAGLGQIKNAKNKVAFEKLLNGRDTIRVMRASKDVSKRFLFDESTGAWTDKNFAGFDKAFNDCIPRLEYVEATKRLDDVSKFGKKTPIGLMLSSVLSAILEKSSNYAEFKEKFENLFQAPDSEVKVKLDELSGKVKLHLEKQFPDCTKVTFEVSEPAFDELLKNFLTTVDDGVETRSDEKGDGMQRALMLAIIKTYADYRRQNDDSAKSFLFIIDEGELHLHPSAQRQLKNALLDLARQGDQVFLSTHSSVLVVDEDPIQTIYKVEKTNQTTQVSAASRSDKVEIIYELLGGSPADLLLPNNFLIVEGRSERDFLKAIIERFYGDKKAVQIVMALGDAAKQKDSVYAIQSLFVPLTLNSVYDKRFVILLDKPKNDTSLNKLLSTYPTLKTNNQIYILDTTTIEEYYPAKWKLAADKVRDMKDGEKVDLAKRVGAEISKDLFEKEMPVIQNALQAAWSKAY